MGGANNPYKTFVQNGRIERPQGMSFLQHTVFEVLQVVIHVFSRQRDRYIDRQTDT